MIKAKDIFFSWVLTLFFGSLITPSFISMDYSSFIFVIIYAVMFSAPYVVLNTMFHKKGLSFKKSQVYHFVFFIISAAFAYFFWSILIVGMIATYFAIGVLVQYGMFILNKEAVVEDEKTNYLNK
ncbi:MAG: hypothetical protein ACI9XP_001261 [Lentimonas sp.]|jgi:hypothetical protein